LYWLTANLADAGPLVLMVDDAHWGDRASLRFLDFLARRIEDLAVVLAVAARPAEPGAEQDLLDGLAGAGSAVVLRPASLSPAAVRALVEDALGTAVAPEFAEAAVDMTAGNPLLVRELARTAHAQGLTGRADEVDAARTAVPRTIARSVVGRLRRLSLETLAVARGLAVLGDRAAITHVAELAGVDLPAARAAQATLIRVGLLDPDHLRFQHPLIQEAVAADLVGGEHSAWHRRAADVLSRAGAPPEEVSLHLLRCDPGHDPRTASVLTEAGHRAIADGAPDVAIRLLRRALAEPPATEDTPAVLLALGTAGAATGTPDALDQLDAAAALGDPPTAARAAKVRFHRLVMTGRLEEAAGSLRGVLEAVAPVRAELAEDLRELLLDALPYAPGDVDEYLGAVERAARRGRPGGLAHLCWIRASEGATAAQVLPMVRRALADRALVRGVTLERFSVFYVIEALLVLELADEAADVLADCRQAVRRTGSLAGRTSLAFVQPQWHRLFGDLRHAEADVREALAAAESLGAAGALGVLRGMLTGVLTDRGELDEADEVARLLPASEGDWIAIGVHNYRARLRLEQGRPAEALDELERQLALERVFGRRMSNREPTRALTVRALAALGRAEEARALADEALAAVLPSRVAGAEAHLRLARARALDDDAAALAELRLAAEAAERSPSRQLRARALGDLGSMLRRSGLRSQAREPLRRARELAHQCGASGLERQLHEELVVAGARPRRVALSGLDALTASERRIAELAAQGLRNRDIAETLFVTTKTVEVHLGRAYAKLDIQGRSQLAEALGAQPAGMD
jgi:DNA-binding CsgD family transcriptional regulator